MTTTRAAYRIDPVHRRVEVTCEPGLAPADVIAVQGAIGADPAFCPDHALLFDLTRCDLAAWTAADLRRAAGNTPFSARSARAFVAGSDSTYGLLRMFLAYSSDKAEEDRIGLFRDRAAALRWLEGR